MDIVTSTSTSTNNPPTPSTPSTPSPSRRSQPSSFPFLFVSGLLFYFFSRSPSAPDTQTRADLLRTFDRRKQEVIGLSNWLNSSTTLSKDLFGKTSISHPNLSFAPVTPSLCYPSNHTFGRKNLVDGQQFISRWLDQVLHRADPPHLFWRNLTGHFKGQWKSRAESLDWYPPAFDPVTLHPNDANISSQLNSSSSAPNSSYSSQRGMFPWTTIGTNQSDLRAQKWVFRPDHRIGYNLRESPLEQSRLNISMIRGSMYISAANSEDVQLEVEGVHFQDQGRLYLRAGPSRIYLDTRIHLASALDIPPAYLSPSTLNDSMTNPHRPTPQQSRIGEVVMSDLIDRMRKVQGMLQTGDIRHENDDRGNIRDSDNDLTANCTFIIYGSLTPLPQTTTQTAESLFEYEQSLTAPTGASISAPNPTHPMFQSLMISPNCGLVLETDEMPVLLAPVFWAKGRMYGWVAGLVMGFQCWLLVWQMDGRQSPSSLSRMSYFALVAQIIMDAWTFSSHLTLSVVTNNISSQPLLIPAFFACLNAVLFGMRYGTLIRMHAPTSTEPAPVGTNTENTIGRDTDYVQVPTTDSEPLGSDISPIPGSQSQPRSRSCIPRWLTGIRNWVTDRPSLLVTAIILSLIAAPVVLYSWQPLILCVLYSYWVPQIIHNVQHGTSRRGLRKRYVMGTTLCRLFLPLYVWGCPHNVLFVETNGWIWLLSLYTFFQALVLILQDYLGARFFLSSSWFAYEPIWDYHPLKLPSMADLEHGRAGAGADGEGGGAEKMPECVICFEELDVVPTSPTTSGREERRPTEAGLFSRWSYMVPPCHHIAHTKCLESWLAIKSECPVCRRPLPPI